MRTIGQCWYSPHQNENVEYIWRSTSSGKTPCSRRWRHTPRARCWPSAALARRALRASRLSPRFQPRLPLQVDIYLEIVYINYIKIYISFSFGVDQTFFIHLSQKIVIEAGHLSYNCWQYSKEIVLLYYVALWSSGSMSALATWGPTYISGSILISCFSVF